MVQCFVYLGANNLNPSSAPTYKIQPCIVRYMNNQRKQTEAYVPELFSFCAGLLHNRNAIWLDNS